MNQKGVKYFDRYLKIAPLSHALWRAIEAQEFSRFNFKKSVLDIGCGFGEFGGVFFSSQVEMGIDINESEILQAASSGKYKKTIAADARHLPFKSNSFRTVISISTLEHIPQNYKVFKEVFRVLKPGGQFIYTVPTEKLFTGLILVKIFNFLGLKKISYLYFRALNKAFKHVFVPSEEIWTELAKKTGFTVEKSQGTISQTALSIWELGLVFAAPSQIAKLISGKRLTMLSKLKVGLFKPIKKFVTNDPAFKANIIVVARKPSNS